MRPQRLALKNFMPFRLSDGCAHDLDFSTLDLFAITGPTGSGKSSLIDAIVWCLYGRTARYSSDSKGVISTGESVCEVAFDFTVGARWFRAVRRTGKTTESGLSELEGEEWVQDASGAEQLTKRIEALLGLDFISFTKTVILPQGNYAEFLLSEPSKRRELLARILGLDVYARVSTRAREVEREAKARSTTIRDTLAQYIGVSREQVEAKRGEWQSLETKIEEGGQQEEILQELVRKAEAVTTILSRITGWQEEERTRLGEKELARQKQAEDKARINSLSTNLVQTISEREALGYDPSHHNMVTQAVTHLQEYQVACQEAEQKGQALTLAQQELDGLARKIAEQEQQAVATGRVHQDRIVAMQAEIAAGGDMTRLTEKLSEAKRWKELRQRQTQGTEEKKTSEEKLARAKALLSTLTPQEEAKERELHDLAQQREQAREDEYQRELRMAEAGRLAQELQDAARQEKQAGKEVNETRVALQTTEQKAQEVRNSLPWAEQEEQKAVETLEQHRRQHEVEHLRQSLHMGDPCPVCLTLVGELPPVSQESRADFSLFQQAAEAAREALTQAQKAWQDADMARAVVRTKKEAAERNLAEQEQKRGEAQERFIRQFPGFSSLAVALKALQTQQQELITKLKDLKAKAKVKDQEKQTLLRQRERTQKEEATLSEALRSLAESLTSGEEQLAALTPSLAPYLANGDDPEMILTARREALLQAQKEVEALEKTHREAEEALGWLKNQQVKKEGDLQVLTLQQKTAKLEAEKKAETVRESLNISADSPLPDLLLLEGELLTLSQKKEKHTILGQQEEVLRGELEQAEKQAEGVRADLQARERVLGETQQKLTQAEQSLQQAREDLQARVVHKGISGIGLNGEGLKEHLDSAREQKATLREQRSRLEAEIKELERRCGEKEKEEKKLQAAETEGRLAVDLHKLLGAEFTDFLSQGAVAALMHEASTHLQRLTNGRYALDIAYKRRAIDIQIVDHEDMRRTRPAHSLSGGETFLASLAIALALSQSFREAASGNAVQTSTECLILDEGFGTLDREGLQLVAETLQGLQGEEGRMIGAITHVEEVAAAMPKRIEVHKGNRTSTVIVRG